MSTEQVRDMIPVEFQTLPLRKLEPNKFRLHLYKDFICVSGKRYQGCFDHLSTILPLGTANSLLARFPLQLKQNRNKSKRFFMNENRNAVSLDDIENNNYE